MAEFWTDLTSEFTVRDWLLFWSVVIAFLSLVANTLIAVWNVRRVGKRLERMDAVIEEGLSLLDDKVSGIDYSNTYIQGVLEGAGFLRGPRRR